MSRCWTNPKGAILASLILFVILTLGSYSNLLLMGTAYNLVLSLSVAFTSTLLVIAMINFIGREIVRLYQVPHANGRRALAKKKTA